MLPRVVRHRYADALDTVWVETARQLGFRVERTPNAYATTDGQGVIAVGTSDTMDADDCLAQVLFHEFCHALVQGEALARKPDWGLDNETTRDTHREHACLRLQATLARRHGLRRFLAPTTDYRAYYDALPDDALTGDSDDPSIELARAGLLRASRAPWRDPLDAALRATATITTATASFAEAPLLYAEVAAAEPAVHPTTGLPIGPRAERCATCAWYSAAASPLGPEQRPGRCRVANRPTRGELHACLHWEEPLDCQACGACCREAYGAVEVGPRDPALRRHPELIERIGTRNVVRRDGPNCAALARTGELFRCTIYEGRPKTCRDFERAGRHCLDARRRLGLSRPASAAR